MRTFLFLLIAIARLQKTEAKADIFKPGLEVKVYETGVITVGRDTVSSDELARYIQTRLFKSYMGTGQMPVGIFVTKADDAVPQVVLDVVVKEVQEGQRRALTELCLEKYKRLYESIDKKKQNRLKKQFPVLFQSSYS
ncbi:MAG TPA: hypothetical protein VGO58_12780 [Chitinophagaceae bacterium]|jgi:hypothetical protein|nr:hypothetical protein [Chitinophagaceae bacterium]